MTMANQHRLATISDLGELETRLTKWVVAIAVGISIAVLGLIITVAGVLITLLK